MSKTESTGKRIGYARVSTYGQDLKAQVAILKQEGCTKIFQEKFTGTKTDRPQFNKALLSLEEGSTLIVTKLDRLARNTKEGIEVIEELFKRGIKVHVLNVGLLENTPMGIFFLTTLLAVAEMERSMIVERTQEGKQFAKKNNPNFKEGRPKVDEDKINAALELLKTRTYKEVVKVSGISKSTLIRAKKEHEAEAIKKEM